MTNAIHEVGGAESRLGLGKKNAGFNLSVGCFGPTLSKTSPNGQIRDFTGSHARHSMPNYVARFFYPKKIKKNGNMVQKNSKMLIFVKKIFEKLHA